MRLSKKKAKELVEELDEIVLEVHREWSFKDGPAFEVVTESGLFLVTPDGRVRRLLGPV